METFKNDPLNPTLDESAADVAALVDDFRRNEKHFLSQTTAKLRSAAISLTSF